MPENYIMNGGPKGLPILGVLLDLERDPIKFMKQSSLKYGDIIPYQFAGQNIIQLNHPDFVRQVLMDNYKNYPKSKSYIRFASALGKGILTTDGEKWRRDRQKIQPMFKREQVEGYYFDIVNTVSEKYKRRWVSMTQDGAAEVNISEAMPSITTEIILRVLFGKDNLEESDIKTLQDSCRVMLDYLKRPRLLPKVDLRKLFLSPQYFLFKKELACFDAVVKRLLEQYKKGALSDPHNMLVLLLGAQRNDPEHFTEQDIRDQIVTMVFAGFESTSLVMQWMWYELGRNPAIVQKLRDNITQHAPCTMQADSSGITYDSIGRMDYVAAAVKEAMRLYPPFYVTTRTAQEDDYFGDFKVKRGSAIIVPQITMQRHPRWWKNPDNFIPERFLDADESSLHPGLYFPFNQGPRKCIGYRLAEMEACVVFAKLLPFFNAIVLNTDDIGTDPGITLKLKHPLRLKVEQLGDTTARNYAIA